MERSYQLRISGIVQGVFFRASTRDMARTIDVKGYVKNEKDGAVMAEIEGDEDAVNKLIQWCHNGPSGARVDRVDIVEQPLKGYTQFEIRRF